MEDHKKQDNRFQLLLDDEMRKKLEAKAQEHRVSMSAIIKLSLTAWMKDN